jgi:hypothetical protein
MLNLIMGQMVCPAHKSLSSFGWDSAHISGLASRTRLKKLRSINLWARPWLGAYLLLIKKKKVYLANQGHLPRFHWVVAICLVLNR